MKHVALSLALLASFNLKAAEEKKEEKKEAPATLASNYEKLKASPLKLVVQFDTTIEPDDAREEKFDKSSTLTDYILSYKFNDSNKLSVDYQRKNVWQKNQAYQHQTRRTTVTYTNNTLKQETSGINLNLGIARREYGPQGRAAGKATANTRFQTSVSWASPDKSLNLGSFQEYVVIHFPDQKDVGDTETFLLWNPTFSYKLTDKFSVNGEGVNYFFSNNGTDSTLDLDWLVNFNYGVTDKLNLFVGPEYYYVTEGQAANKKTGKIGFDYSFNEVVSTTVFAEWTLVDGFDSKDGMPKNAASAPVYRWILAINAF